MSRAPAGLRAPPVRVEVHLGPGLPAFHLVGLPHAVVRESRERVRSALLTGGFRFPTGRITVNLSPADLPKEGGRFDLPIAVGILAASGQVPRSALRSREFYGELSLDGALRETRKLLPAIVAACGEGHEVILPEANALEASLVASPTIRLARSLSEVGEALHGRVALQSPSPQPAAPPSPLPDLADVRGQLAGKRALELAAAGGHSLLLIGPPGVGKTLLAQRLPAVLPPLAPADALEVACLESAAGGRPSGNARRPYRCPHHTATMAALVGDAAMRPGEMSLAHLGVLFLDELPEFARNVLEALREPLESGVVMVARAKHSHAYPARFQLIAAMNPCPCGYAGDPTGRCVCNAAQILRYRNKLSQPILERIDMHVELTSPPVAHLWPSASLPAEKSAAVAARVAAAHERQLRRQGKLNARLTPDEAGDWAAPEPEARALLTQASAQWGFSARSLHRILKLAQTCADLAEAPAIRTADVAEAVRLRVLDRRAS